MILKLVKSYPYRKRKIEVWVQENTESIKAALNQRFLLTNQAYQVTGIDRTIPGLMRLICELTQSNEYDNFTLEIADYYRYVHEYTITINNTQPIGVTAGNTVQLSTTVKDNGTTIEKLRRLSMNQTMQR